MDDLKLYKQFLELSLSFPRLILQKNEGDTWHIDGNIKFSVEYAKRRIDDEYYIRMIISGKYPDEIPRTFETGNRIPQNFHHYQDDALCLGPPLALSEKFLRRPTLLGFIENCVIPYLFSYSYKCKYKKLPFGELSHGGLGLLEYYQELFGVKDYRRVLKLIYILSEENYHYEKSRCPCGTGKRLNSCHGGLLLKLKRFQSSQEFQKEYLQITSIFGKYLR